MLFGWSKELHEAGRIYSELGDMRPQLESLKGTDHLRDLNIYGRIILKWNVKEI
jgi:hypothetical protein